ncbi:MAG: SDR family oxidoreductase, partial [Planctomycetota bacterium]|nr:SDR family oxidoreductase [Planctomycetota bacterium]
MQHWERELGRQLPRPVVLSGDITEAGFGLSAEDARWVRENCDAIIHSAAILEFYGKDRTQEPWRTNLNGTQNMINLCRDLEIHDIHYVSTAYVAGYQEGRVMEDSLNVGQAFRNDYEESKFMAETLVRSIDFADHVTVYRPAVIAGDSRTGYTNTYHGIYLYLRLMALMIPTLPPGPDGKRHTPIRMRMTGDERRNIIPVEWVSAVMCRLFETQEARGLTYHIAPENPISSGQIIEYCGDCFNSIGATFCGHDEIDPPDTSRAENEDQWMFERMYWENAETYAPYERSDNEFDLTNLKRFTSDIVCPDFDRTVMSRYIEYGNEDRWGKRKIESEAVSFWSEDQLTSQPGIAAESTFQTIGLDVVGPGGCQLTIEVSRAGIHSVVRGLPDESVPILHVANSALAELMQSGVAADLTKADWDLPEGMVASELSELLLGALQPESAGIQS